ncbi:hypothetical protein SAMN05421682_11221 [Chryseobacterium indoltheticum]|uniref:Uncharacterized protein n=1 Tax=Chryseobacterium indoltheticum TaxID=254 RepID=A0A381F5B0_9FLAO|nr:hypothetical protein SAMN05421682_11221 [Chryseobacterium indoltheticum]SUX41789.1 Uncharacterised protein [Chryseobacterium indoltheticum]
MYEKFIPNYIAHKNIALHTLKYKDRINFY